MSVGRQAEAGNLTSSSENTNYRDFGSMSGPPLCSFTATMGRLCLNRTHAANGLCWKHQSGEGSASRHAPRSHPFSCPP